MRFRGRSERGATAVLFALLAATLLGVGAVALDMGQVYAKRSALQSNVDLAVLAAAANLGARDSCATSAAPSGPTAADAAKDYLTKAANEVDGQYAANLDGGSFDDGDGFIQCVDWRVKLWAPDAAVDFGLARVFLEPGDDTYIDVPAYAEAQIGTPGGAPAPFFIPSQCSWGRQVIKSGAQPPEALPQFPAGDADGSGAVPDLDSVDPIQIDYEGTATDPKPVLQVGGKRLNGAVNVSFTRSNRTHYSRLTPDTAAGEGLILPGNTSALVSVEVPDRVVEIEGVWYIRVETGAGWSKKAQAIAFDVVSPADPTPGCGVKNEGDFGLLDSPRADTNQLAESLRLNIEKGIDHEIAPWTTMPPPPVDKACMPASTPVPGAKLDTAGFPQGQPPNCVNILNGNKIDMVSDGLLSRLNKDTTTGCDPGGTSNRTTVAGVSINNDVLSCFLAPGVTVGQVSTSTGAEEEAVDPSIFDSPRFMWLPVINNPIAPSNGFYPVVEFRPAFLTDEGMGAHKGSSNATSINGIALDSSGNKVAAIWMIAINPASMPASAPDYKGPIGPYIPGTTKVIQLVK